MWRDIRWITDALQYARYKHPLGGVPITWLVDESEEPAAQKNDSTSSTTDYLPTPSPSPEMRRRKATSGKTYLYSLRVLYFNLVFHFFNIQANFSTVWKNIVHNRAAEIVMSTIESSFQIL